MKICFDRIRLRNFESMFTNEMIGLFGGAIILGTIHGIEPGHGWPVAASYALDQTNKWVYGFAASFILGVGHLFSSIAMVAVFFYAKAYFNLTQVNEPISVLGGVQIGGPVSLVAGILLILLGLREYFHGHSHNEDNHTHSDHYHDHIDGQHGHDRDDLHSNHSHSQKNQSRGLWNRLREGVRFRSGSSHSHSYDTIDKTPDRGLLGIAWFAFVLGFAHEEEFEIIALCAGSNYCLELMSVYAITVIVGIVGLTMLLIAGYENFEEEVEQYTPYLPVFSAVVLVLMGVGFITGLL